MTVETPFEDLADKIRAKAYRKYSTSPLVDDLMQEAVIEGWRMYMDGRSEGYIIFWAVKRAARFLGEVPPPFTGNSDSHGGTRMATTTAVGDANREKIKQAEREFRELHGREPSHAELGRHLGMDSRKVSKYRNRANFNLPTSGAKNPTITYYENWTAAGEDEDLDPSRVKALSYDGFEDQTVDSLLVQDLLPELKDREREVVYLHYWRDLPQAEVARQLKLSPAYTHRLHKAALDSLRELLDVGT